MTSLSPRSGDSADDALAAATASGSQPTHEALGGHAGKRPTHSVHINVRADPDEDPSSRIPSWLSPRPTSNPSTTFVESPTTGRSASSRLGYGLTRPGSPSPGGDDERDEHGLPRPVPSTPSKERGHTFSPAQSHPSWFSQTVSDALRRLEVYSHQRELPPTEIRGSNVGGVRADTERDGALPRAWRLATASLGALWIDTSSWQSPGPRWQSNAVDGVTESSRGRGDGPMARFVDPFRRRFGLGRSAFLTVILLLIFGLLDAFGPSTHIFRGGVKPGKNALVALEQLGVAPERLQGPEVDYRDPLRLRGLWLFPTNPPPASGNKVLSRGSTEADVTAIVLNWKRFDNVKLVVAYLCRFDFFRVVIVWNNNADTPLSRTVRDLSTDAVYHPADLLDVRPQHFSSTHCPAHRLQIVNAPRNLYFLSRFLACASAPTKSCYFQDDDWIVRPLRSMYAQYRRGLDGDMGDLVVQTDTRTSLMYGWEWCFYSTSEPLVSPHGCRGSTVLV